ncbi:Phosphatidic acid phosphatase type 2/haloperoxidase [Corchorus olitorius]|uniref:Phosphatidic acid phosphatase type 2/haloperoxidase n=1 Tax=Corchorus olitorius TaxID=93759 RepID=A0A1R3HTI1_9ROSI|nr:Phosphatidic acid phosphatase type 2/haloperoxidase [Corchorus olitorius]
MFFALGILISQFINELIKTSVQQARPSETCVLLETCDSHGWPSGHSQYMFFFAVYYTLLSCKGIGLVSKVRVKWAALFLPWSLAFLTMYSRVYLGYHTVPQVFAGASLGIVLGLAWFWVVNSKIFGYFPLIEESAFGRFFYVKDSSHISDVLKFEYDNARSARNNMAARKAMASKNS